MGEGKANRYWQEPSVDLYFAEGVFVMSTSGFHVVRGPRGWSVRKTGAVRASSIHRTQAEAIAAATAIAQRQRAKLYIHDRDGRIRERNSYTSELRPVSG